MGSRLDELVGRWQAAEERLYPVVMVRPELYERYVVLVRAVADELAGTDSPERLAAAYEHGAEVVAAVVERDAIPVEGLDLGLVAGAAFSLRYRELLADAHRREAADRISTARGRGDAWALIYETGSVERAPYAPYSRLEMHLPDGMGIHAYAEGDPASGRARFGLEVVKLDPASGARLEPGGERLVFTDASRWRDEVAKAKARLSIPPP